MTSLSDSTDVLMKINGELPVTYNTKSSYEAGLVMNAPEMNKDWTLGYPQDRTFANMFPPVCIKSHWDSEAISKLVLPNVKQVPLPVDPRPWGRICTQYMTTFPPKTNTIEDAQARAAMDPVIVPGGSASRGVPFEKYVNAVNAESDLLLNHPQDKCEDNKWQPAEDSDLFNNHVAPPVVEKSLKSFPELSRPIATIVPKGPYKCRAEADEKAWNASARVFNNPTREDRMAGAKARLSEAPLSVRGAVTARVAETPRVWPTRSIVFYVPRRKGDGGDQLLRLAQAFRARDYEVTVYSSAQTRVIDGVSYHDLSEYVPNDIYSNIILWGDADLLDNFQYRPNTKALVLNLDDDILNDYVCQRTVQESVDKIVVKSSYHRSLYNCYGWTKFEVIPPAISVEYFTDIENRHLPRERYQVLITEYTPAVLTFVNTAWIRIKSTYPQAELHIWSVSGDKKEKVAPVLAPKAKGNGIVLHGNFTDMNESIRERFKSSIHVWLEDSDLVSCQPVRLSALAGCIPIMPNRGVYTELPGINISGAVKEEFTMIEYAKSISAIFKDHDYAINLKNTCQRDTNLKGWNATAERYLTIFRGLDNTKKPFSINAFNSLFEA